MRRLLTVLLTAVFAISVLQLLHQQKEYAKGQADQAEAARTAGLLQTLPEPAEAPATPDKDTASFPSYAELLAQTDLAALQQTNPDVLGWLWLPQTGISYPLVQTGNNDYYLTHSWKNEPSAVGSIFLDARSAPDLSDFNSILYGHRMRDGSMFAALQNYSRTDYWQQAPDLYLLTAAGVQRWRIFAAYKAPTDALLYEPSLNSPEQKAGILQYALDNSQIQTDLRPGTEDRILTMVTCTGHGYADRWVVQAVLQEE